MAAPSKPYGLIFPKKAQQKTLVKHSVFMDDSDEEASVGESLQREALKKQAMKQTKLEIQRALAEDSTVYEYDNIYDDIQQKKAESQASSLLGKGEKKPKYIHNILQAAELRKKEQEKRMEKKIQKEREMEGGAFDDKEAFVTSAYKRKLQERAEEEEREKREAAVEACLDVTKQKDLSGFYRHLLNQTVGEEEMPNCSLREARVKEEKSSSTPSGSRPMSISPDGRPTGEENPRADLEMAGAKVRVDSRASSKTEALQESTNCSKEGSKHPKSQRDSRSSSEESSYSSKLPAVHTRRKEHGGRSKEKRRHPGDKDHEREEHPPSEYPSRRWEEREDKQRRKEREEIKSPEKERSKREGKARSRERDERTKARSEKQHERSSSSSSPRSLVTDDHQAEERKDGGETPSSSEGLPKLKRKSVAEEAEHAAKPPGCSSKFAKRSNPETILSARDRYLMRQVACAGTKSYIEKEED